jgi:SAM-dependent methyltransferase
MASDDVQMEDRRSAPSALRNRGPILDVLKATLTSPGSVLEIGSGTGEHATWFAPHLPHLTWQPTERDPEMRASIAAWGADVDAPNLLAAQSLDVLDYRWAPADDLSDLVAVVAICVVHITPWAVTEALIRGAADRLPTDGVLYLYGPYTVDGAHTAPSNAKFDAVLRATDPLWGVRDLGDVTRTAEACGFDAGSYAQMPANNLSLVYRKV